MRTIIFLVCFIPFTIYSQEILRIAVMSDTHYLAEKNDGTAERYSQLTGELLNKVLADYLDKKIDVLLVSGDLTHCGDQTSHREYAKHLERLVEKDIKVFVIPGNHDVNMPAARQLGDKAVQAKDFAEIYARHGYKSALDRDETSLSYLAELNADTWLLSIDVARYADYQTMSLSDGILKTETESWLLECLARAKKENKTVYAMMHWGLVEHITMQARIFPEYLVKDWERIANLLADGGVRAIFTGHSHANDITAFKSHEGNTIYDIETGILAAYPFSYRLLEVYKDSVQIKTYNIESISSRPNLLTEDRARMKRLSHSNTMSKLRALGLADEKEQSNTMADLLSDIFLLHLRGDEVLTDDLKQKIDALSKVLDSPIDYSDIALDFAPADNNLTIHFDK